AQESWIRIWKALSAYDGRASLSTWIYAITRNRCLTAIGRRSQGVPWEEAEEEILLLETAMPEAEELANLLRALVNRLPDRYRRSLVLYYYEDRSISEVADMLGIPEGTVKTSLHRARAALAEQLRNRGLDDSTLWLQEGV